MNSDELGIAIGEIRGGVKSLEQRANRHDIVHANLQEKMDILINTVTLWKGAKSLGGWIIAMALGAGGLLIFLLGTGFLK